MKAAMTTTCAATTPTMQNVVEFAAIIAVIVVLVWCGAIVGRVVHQIAERMKK